MSRVLVVEDDGKIRANLVFRLRERGHEARAMATAEEAFVELRDAARPLPDLLLLDIRLPGMSGVDLVRSLAAAERLPTTVVVSGEASISETVEALRLGVHDFIEKPFSRERLHRSIDNALEHAALRREVETLRSRLGGAAGGLLGESAALDEVRRAIARAGPTEARVLILGETGTGKEVVADALHRASRRRDRPFIKINCAAIPESLVEDELFGHAKGAFTDARAAKPGLFEEADGGTLLLDEIGDMPLGLQARLLRVLEDGRVRRVGETRNRGVDVRVLAATHQELEGAVARGEFREDLYYRLATLPIRLPPLRERAEDIRPLFVHFLDDFAQQHKARRRRVEEEVFARLEAYPWPGNVRELKGLAERLVIFGGDPVRVEDLPSDLSAGGTRPENGLLRLGTAPTMSLRALREQCEKEYIEIVLRRHGWSFTAAARSLGLGRTYLHQKAASLGIRRPGEPGRESGES